MMVALILLARTFDPEAFAAYSYFHLTVIMLATYAAVGLGVSASRFFAEHGAGRDDNILPLGTVVSMSIVISAVASTIILHLPAPWIDAGLPIPRWILALGVGSLAFGVVPSGAILGLEKYRDAALAAGLGGLALLGVTLVAVVRQDLQIAMIALVTGSLVRTSGEYYVVQKTVGLRALLDGIVVKLSAVRRLISFSGPMFIVSLMAASGSWIVGRIILSGPNGEYEFALYAIGLQWFALGLVLPGMISRVVLPRLIRQSDDAGRRSLVWHNAIVATAAASIFMLVVTVLGEVILSLYGPIYVANRFFIGSFMMAAVVSAPLNTLGNALLARDLQLVWLLLTVIWFIVLIVLSVITAGLGAWAGALSLNVSFLVFLVLTTFYAFRKTLI